MELNEWTTLLRRHYDSATQKYREGLRDFQDYFSASEVESLATLGLKPVQIFDYVDDLERYGEPDWDTILLMVAARRDYFIHEMKRQWNGTPLKKADLPAKSDTFEGIEWLPRMVPKAQAYLQGTLPDEIMYGCGGDREFLKLHQIHPADFLRVTWSAKGDLGKIADYVKNH